MVHVDSVSTQNWGVLSFNFIIPIIYFDDNQLIALKTWGFALLNEAIIFHCEIKIAFALLILLCLWNETAGWYLYYSWKINIISVALLLTRGLGLTYLLALT